MKELLTSIRDKTAILYSWFIILLITYSFLTKNSYINILTLTGFFVLSLSTILIFHLIFSEHILKSLRFITRLNLFFFLFVGIEIILIRYFPLLPIITIKSWIIFFGIVLIIYLISLFIFEIYKRKKQKEYTDLLNQYQLKRKDDKNHE